MSHPSTNDESRFPSPAPPLKAAGRPLPVGLAIGFGCGGALFMACLFVGGLFAFVTVTMRSSEAYQHALSAARGDPAVVAALGAPIEAAWFINGEIKVNGPSGHANLAIPVSGPRGSGQIDVVADKAAGKWIFKTLSVQVPGRPTPLDLLPPAPSPSAVTSVP